MRLLLFLMIEVGNIAVAQMLPPTLLHGFPTWVLILIAVVSYGTPALVLAPASWRSRIWRALRISPPAITWKHVAYVATAIAVIQFSDSPVGCDCNLDGRDHKQPSIPYA